MIKIHSLLKVRTGPIGLYPNDNWTVTFSRDRAALLWNGVYVTSIFHKNVNPPYMYQPILVERMEYTRSVGSSETISQNVISRIRNAVVTTGAVRYKKPKEPTYYPLKFHMKPPIFKEFHLNQLGYPKKPKSMSDFKWERKLPIYLRRRLRLFEQIVRFREKSYKTRLQIYESKLANFNIRVLQHKEIYSRRVANYQRKLAIWKLNVEKATKRTLRLLPRTYTEQHEYSKMIFESILEVPSVHWVSWNSTPNDTTTIRWSTARATTGLSDLVDVPNNREAYLAGVTESIISALRPSLEQHEGHLVKKLYEKIANQKVHFGNLIAERIQTWDLLTRSFKLLTELVTFKKVALRKIVHSITSPRELANNILAFKFGMEPLVSDIIEGYNLLNDELSPLEVFVRTSDRRFVDVSSNGVSFKGYVETKYTLKLTTENDFVRGLSQLGLLDASQAGWELAPWSFLIDWVIPIGTWIASQNALMGLDVTSCMKSYRLIGEFKVDATTTTDLDYIQSVEASGLMVHSLSGTFRGSLKTRRFESLPPTSRIFHVKSPWSWSHLIETIALAVQRLKLLSRY